MTVMTLLSVTRRYIAQAALVLTNRHRQPPPVVRLPQRQVAVGINRVTTVLESRALWPMASAAAVEPTYALSLETCHASVTARSCPLQCNDRVATL